MKKLLALILAAALALSLVACGGGSGAGDTNTPSTGNGDTTSTNTPSGGGEDNTPSTGNGDTTSTDTPSGGEDSTPSTGNGDTTSTDTPSGGEDSTPSMTKEEMLQVGEDGDVSELNSLIAENIVSAKQAYCGKTLIMEHTVDEIKEDCIIFNHGMGSVIVHLPEEDIINLKTKQYITIVGITNDEFITTKESRYGPMTQDYTDCVMEQAYLVTDRYEYTGTPKSKNSDFNGAWNVEFQNRSVQQLVYFDESIDVTQYVGKEITFSAKVIDGKYYDIIIKD